MSKFCNQSSWMFGFHLQNTNNVTRYHPLVSLSGILKSSSVCCFATRLNFNETHVRRLEVHRQRRCQLVPTKSQTNDHITSSTHEDINEDGISKATLVWRAIKLPIYSVALVPLTVGSAAAYLQTGVYSAKQYALLLASSILIITWLNLSNDVYDFDTGADINKKESVVNMIGSRSGTLMAALLLLALGSTGLVWAAMEAANMRSMLLLASAITCGYIYQVLIHHYTQNRNTPLCICLLVLYTNLSQCPPFRLSYLGLGEPLCFAAFGPFATTAFYLLQGSSSTMVKSLPITGTILSASVLVGITTSLILFCSHFHQITGDKAVGKLSPLLCLIVYR
uniref:2-carboxy-1,4-naphthoquinone phytyltransferase, chloroplastic isoform X3 n=1 Tax=Erigeron canadensis TaxID=72917 RepID=UPI001CB89CA0|nr:2-carboxy-1,4-naphthoquinone phytyltransferase, chloroplastic isoform X3 [Erigeron canadensis]